MAEVGLNGDAPDKDYSQVSISEKVIITTNITNCENVTFTFTTKLFQLYAGFLRCKKTSTGTRFTVPFKTCSTKSLCNIVSKVSKMICNYVESFYNKSWKNFEKNMDCTILIPNHQYTKTK